MKNNPKATNKINKPRASEYEKKVAFEGTFEDMIAISVKDAEKKVKANKKPKNN